jgi:hypothetical protein
MLCFIIDLHALCRRIFVCLLSEASCGTGLLVFSFSSLLYHERFGDTELVLRISLCSRDLKNG